MAVLAGLILDSTHHIDAAKEGRGHVVVLLKKEKENRQRHRHTCSSCNFCSICLFLLLADSSLLWIRSASVKTRAFLAPASGMLAVERLVIQCKASWSGDE